jgi:hypothetical protein
MASELSVLSKNFEEIKGIRNRINKTIVILVVTKTAK